MIKQWRFIPRVVKELARLDDMDRSKKSFHRKDLCRRAMICKRIYETEFNQTEDDSTTMKKKKKGHGEHGTSSKKSFHRKDLCRRAMICKYCIFFTIIK
ncbi:hypothetical protein Syun_011251 [Stephania yunnanensis]|uniref:Uncharacterized protein n=1 Tax=Stephania yunnanensis TaxID=152371 RepID=A0AAP0PIB5_9MAGN